MNNFNNLLQGLDKVSSLFDTERKQEEQKQQDSLFQKFIKRPLYQQVDSFKGLFDKGTAMKFQVGEGVDKPKAESVLKKVGEGDPGIKESFLTGVARDFPRSIAQLTLKGTGEKEYDPALGTFPGLEKSIFGERVVKKPEGKFQTGLAVLGAMPIIPGKKKAAEKFVSIFGKNLTLKQGKIQAKIIALISDVTNQRIPQAKGLKQIDKLAKQFEGAVEPIKREIVPVFKGFEDLTTKVIQKLKGRKVVSKQFISDMTNASDLKQAERDIIRRILKEYPKGKIPVKEFANKVKTELLPLKMTKFIKKKYSRTQSLYSTYTLPKEVRGNIVEYAEHIYESPVTTRQGKYHYPGVEKYFGHTRIEDLSPTTRRIIELQADLYQKGRLKGEIADPTIFEGMDGVRAVMKKEKLGFRKAYDVLKNQQIKRLQTLQQYNNPTAHFRMLREEVKRAAKDGKTKLQFPTGETVMKIEGLGETAHWEIVTNRGRWDLTPEKLKIGLEVEVVGQKQIVTDVLGDGKFKAVLKTQTKIADKYPHGDVAAGYTKKVNNIVYNPNYTEAFDISGKIDTSNPIFRFYEKEVQKYLNRAYSGMKRITDPQGVEWFEIPIKKEQAKMPIEAFGALPFLSMPEEKENQSIFNK